MNRLALAAASFALVFVSGCYNLIDGGPQVSETRSVDGFDALRVDDGFRVKFVKGAPQVTVDAPEKVLKYLDTSVKSGRLTISLRSGVTVTSQDTIVITASSAGVDTFEATGGSRITADEVTANPLRLTASGASELVVSGTTADLRVNASGMSKVDASKLVADEASVDASGASKVEVQVLKAVFGSASGGSSVTVTGGADTSKVSTSGGAQLN